MVNTNIHIQKAENNVRIINIVVMVGGVGSGGASVPFHHCRSLLGAFPLF